MPTYNTRRRVPFSPQEMFDVVADVERYPAFLPLCESLVVTDRKSEADRTVLTATMTVGYKAIHEAFTTRVTLIPGEPSILVENVDGPFTRLVNRWRFAPIAGGTEIDFHIDYEFRSTMLRLVMGAVFDNAVRHYAEAFETRARDIYGARTAVVR